MLKTHKDHYFKSISREILAEIDLYDDDMKKIRERYIGIIDQHGVEYAENIKNTSDWLIYLYYCELVNRAVQKKDSVIIDWGGLYGHVTQILREKGFRNAYNYLLGVPSSYKLFLEEFNIHTLYGKSPNRLELDDGSIDVLISSGVLEHIREDGIGREKLIIKEFYRVLRPDGFLFVWNLPTKLCIPDLLSKLSGKWHHMYRYWEGEISHLLKDGGFEILYLERYGFPPVSALNYFSRNKNSNSVDVIAIDFRFSRIPLFNVFCRNFGIVAAKRILDEQHCKKHPEKLITRQNQIFQIT